MQISTTVGKITELLSLHPEYAAKIKVNTRFGFYPIVAAQVTAPNSDVWKIITKCGKTLKTSPDHLMLSND